MDHRLPAGVPAVHVASRLHLATFFPSSPRGRSTTGPPPALTADVRVLIRRHFPFPALAAGPCCAPRRRAVAKVAEDISLRRRASRKLRASERVARAIAEEVLPRVAHPFDRGAVAAAGEEICARVAAACADPRIARGGAHVLVLIDTFACPVVVRPPPPRKPAQARSFVAKTANPCMDLEGSVPAKKRQPVGVIGDQRPKPVEQRFNGWVPW
ncbi:hypothetical protein ACP4OV_004880 [Aristida adscensionis]